MLLDLFLEISVYVIIKINYSQDSYVEKMAFVGIFWKKIGNTYQFEVWNLGFKKMHVTIFFKSFNLMHNMHFLPKNKYLLANVISVTEPNCGRFP